MTTQTRNRKPRKTLEKRQVEALESIASSLEIVAKDIAMSWESKKENE